MTVLLTGATGLLGSHLTDLLLARGERPRVLVRTGDSLAGLAQGGVDIFWGDIADRAALEAAVAGVDSVLHCAARTGPWGDEIEYVRTNVRGLEYLVEAAVTAGVRRIVHVSSITVHGNDVGGTADEASPLRVEPNPYSRSKVAGERLLERMITQQSAPVTIVRPGLLYGPRDAASFGRFATLIQRGRMIIIGSGQNHLPLIYVRDAAQGILLASEIDDAAGRVYLLVNDEPVTQLDYMSAIASELGVPAPSTHIPYRLALAAGAASEFAGHLARLKHAPPLTRFGVQTLGGENRFDVGKARTELGFAPSIGLADGVRLSVAWFRATSALGSPARQTSAA